MISAEPISRHFLSGAGAVLKAVLAAYADENIRLKIRLDLHDFSVSSICPNPLFDMH